MTVKAIYNRGVFRPVHPVHLPEDAEVQIWDQTDQWQEAATAAMALLNVPGTRFVSTT